MIILVTMAVIRVGGGFPPLTQITSGREKHSPDPYPSRTSKCQRDKSKKYSEENKKKILGLVERISEWGVPREA